MSDLAQFPQTNLLHTIIQHLDEPVAVIDSRGRVVFTNEAAADLQGLRPENLEGGKYLGFLPKDADLDEERKLVEATFRDGKSRREEISWVDANGDRRVIEVHIRPLMDHGDRVSHVIETLRDKSLEKRLERQLTQSAKLASVGEVATGIAHEVRNPLTGIRLGLDTLKADLSESLEGQEILEDLTRDIVRLDRVITDLLSFTKPKPHRPDWFPLAPLFRQVTRLVEKGMGEKNIQLSVEVEPEDLSVWADRNQIYQVLLNVLLNSVHAIGNGGDIFLTGRISESINWADERPDRMGYRIAVRDTGKGISEEVLQRLFDPFFTTKTEGTGVGLTTSFSIVRKHNGELRINSREGQGTTAQILLPRGPDPETDGEPARLEIVP